MRKIVTLALILGIVGYNFFALLEGGMVFAATDTETNTSTVNYTVTLDVTSQIRLTCDDTKNLGSISGLTGGDVSGTVDCNVATNNSTGYNMWFHATGTPAMAKVTDGTKTFADYDTTIEPTWSVGAASSSFGFTIASSADAVQDFKFDSGTCNQPSGSTTGSNCWRGFSGASDILVLNRSTETTFDGVTSTFGFQAESGAANSQATGHYSSTVVVTAAIQ